MELKAEYKQTEVGVIPEDWEVKPLVEITTEISDGIHTTPDYVQSSEFFFINGNNLVDGKIAISENTMCVSEIEYRRLRKKLNDRTILISINGTIGNLATFKGETVVLGKSAAYMNVSQNICKDYIYYSLMSAATANYIENELTGTTINNLSLESLRNTPIPLPRTQEEQRAIVTILSDVDALITALDRLIAKKRDIKQAVMQELITGKIRLPGFREKWQSLRFGNVLRVRHGKSQKDVVVNDGAYPILATSGEIGRTNSYLYDKPSVLIGRKGTIDEPQFVDTHFWTIDTLFYTEISSVASPKFIFYKFKTIDWYAYNEASGVPSLNASTVENIEFQCPTFSEQEAIAALLSDLDAEINVLEARREKTRAIKRGMMRELLTGRIRLLQGVKA